MVSKVFEYERKVYYYETDKMGVMHHSNYIRLFEEARVAFLENAGLPYSSLEACGLMSPVISVQCRYMSPLSFDEKFVVETQIDSFNGFRFEITYKIKSRTSDKLCAEGNSQHCFTDKAMKPIRIKNNYREIYDLFESCCND